MNPTTAADAVATTMTTINLTVAIPAHTLDLALYAAGLALLVLAVLAAGWLDGRQVKRRAKREVMMMRRLAVVANEP